MHEYKRTDRIGSEIHRELAALIREELRDPRLHLVTVQEVRVTRDLAHAKVFFTVMGEQEDTDEVAVASQVLKKAAGFLRRELSRRVRLRTIPELHFVYDESVEKGRQLSSLIEQVTASDKSNSD